MRWRSRIFILLVIAVLTSSFYWTYQTAASVNGYIGDEVWYVSASRNILYRLGVQVHYYVGNYEGINVVFENKTLYNMHYYQVESMALTYFNILPSNVTELEEAGILYFMIPKEDVKNFTTMLKEKYGKYCHVVPGYEYPNTSGIASYLNLEHPFLGKDFIMLAMLYEDSPLMWRLPGLIGRFLINILVLLITYRLTKSYIASFIALLFVAYDPLLNAMSEAAMLDIYVAIFVTFLMAMMIFQKRYTSSILVGMAGATKLSGAFTYPVFLLQEYLKTRKISKLNFFKFLLISAFLGVSVVMGLSYYSGLLPWIYFLSSSLAFFVFSLIFFIKRTNTETLSQGKKLIISLSILPLIGFLVPNLPAIAAVGLKEWAKGFIGSTGWMFAPNKGPVISPVWYWFLGKNPFPLHYGPNIFAQTDPVLLILIAVLILAYPFLHRRIKYLWIPFGMFWSIVSLFLLHVLIGYLRDGKMPTQFSFYATPLVPTGAVVAGAGLGLLIRWDAFEESLIFYWNYIKKLFIKIIIIIKMLHKNKEEKL